MSVHRCTNCAWTGELDAAVDLHVRLSPGDTVPDGQCRSCGALVCTPNPLTDSAPDLLAALERIETALEHDPEIYADLLSITRAAITKANGGAR